VSATVIDDSTQAKQGNKFMRVRTSTSQGSIAQDVRIPVYVTSATYLPATEQVATTFALAARSLCFSVWLRAAPGQGPIQGVVALWDLGRNASVSTTFEVGNQWTQAAVTLDAAAPQVRAEIYLMTTNQSLDVDGALLV
jgi:hypothetical protein